MRAPKDATDVLSVLPWRDARVTLLLVSDQGELTVDYAKTLVEKYALLGFSTTQDRVLVCWPGPHSQDIFELPFEHRAEVRRWVKPRGGA